MKEPHRIKNLVINSSAYKSTKKLESYDDLESSYD